MRKLCFSTLALSSLSFSFYKLQGPFVIQAQPVPIPAGQPLTQQYVKIQEQATCLIPEDKLNYQAKPHDISFLFDPVTKFYIITTPLAHNIVSTNNIKTNFILLNPTDTLEQANIPGEKDPIYDFLKCNFEYDPENFWKLKNLKQYESITSKRNVGPLLFGRSSLIKAISPTKRLTDLQTQISPLIMRWYCNLINDQYYAVKRFPSEFVTYYDQDTAEKYPLICNNQEYVPSYQQPCLGNFNTNPIRLRKKFTTNSNNIEICNQSDGVKLYKNDQYGKTIREIDLKSALLDYYNKKYYIESEFARRLEMDKKGNKYFDIHPSTMAWAATQFKHPTLQPQDFELLQNSTILTVWTIRSDKFKPKRFLFKEEREISFFHNNIIQSVIIGLARDNRTGELFHWVIDLERDIEVLFSLESSRKSENQALSPTDYTKSKPIKIEESPYVYNPKAQMDWN